MMDDAKKSAPVVRTLPKHEKHMGALLVRAFLTHGIGMHKTHGSRFNQGLPDYLFYSLQGNNVHGWAELKFVKSAIKRPVFRGRQKYMLQHLFRACCITYWEKGLRWEMSGWNPQTKEMEVILEHTGIDRFVRAVSHLLFLGFQEIKN